MPNTVFMTGTTGFLGTEIAAELLQKTDAAVYVLVRAANSVSAAARLKAVWWEIPALVQAIGSRIVPVCGDMTQPDLGLNDADRSRLASVTHVIHAAAETGIQNSQEQLWRINVTGTQNVLAFAGTFTRLSRFIHISTAYVAGQRKGLEALLSRGFSIFFDCYLLTELETYGKILISISEGGHSL